MFFPFRIPQLRISLRLLFLHRLNRISRFRNNCKTQLRYRILLRLNSQPKIKSGALEGFSYNVSSYSYVFSEQILDTVFAKVDFQKISIAKYRGVATDSSDAPDLAHFKLIFSGYYLFATIASNLGYTIRHLFYSVFFHCLALSQKTSKMSSL